MIDITFEVVGNKYRLTTDEKQFILQEVKTIKDIRSAKVGTEKYSDAKYFRSIPDVFAYVTRTHVLSSETVIYSFDELERVHDLARRSVGDIMRSLSCDITEES